jgi:hypothetical protein
MHGSESLATSSTECSRNRTRRGPRAPQSCTAWKWRLPCVGHAIERNGNSTLLASTYRPCIEQKEFHAAASWSKSSTISRFVLIKKPGARGRQFAL